MGVAVKVTFVPAQIEVEDAVMMTDGVTEPEDTLMTLLVTFAAVVQLALDVMITSTWSPLASELVVNVGELVPVFTPFICH